jgi:hypothetical protein
MLEFDMLRQTLYGKAIQAVQNGNFKCRIGDEPFVAPTDGSIYGEFWFKPGRPSRSSLARARATNARPASSSSRSMRRRRRARVRSCVWPTRSRRRSTASSGWCRRTAMSPSTRCLCSRCRISSRATRSSSSTPASTSTTAIRRRPPNSAAWTVFPAKSRSWYRPCSCRRATQIIDSRRVAAPIGSRITGAHPFQRRYRGRPSIPDDGKLLPADIAADGRSWR